MDGSTGLARPDVQAAYPAAGPNSGYELQGWAAWNNDVPLACAYAQGVGLGAPEVFLGCQSTYTSTGG